MTSSTGGFLFFYYLTEPEDAQDIADNGFVGCGTWSPESTVSLLDRVPSHAGGGIVRVSLAPELVAETMHREASDPGVGFRRFLVPMEFLRGADVVRIHE